MTARFGDPAQLADEHLATAASCLTGRGVSREAADASVREIACIARLMAHMVIVPDGLDADSHPLMRAAISTRHRLSQAAAALPHRGNWPFGAEAPPLPPLARHLTDARLSLAAGHDLLATRSAHSGTTPLPYQHWAGSVNSLPVTAALLGELARWSAALARITAGCSVR
jgi:hypothetical protein